MFFDGKPERLRAFRQGDRQVLRDLYAEYGEMVYRDCRDRLHSPADARDLVQEVFLAAFKEETRLRFSGMSSFQGFVLGIAKNLLLHRFRADRVRHAGNEALSVSNADEPAEPPEIDRKLEEESVRKVLDGFLGELADRERDFFEKHMVSRPARRVTAERLGMSEDQVRYLEKKLREKAIAYLKRVGYLEVAGADLRRAAAAVILLTLFLPTSAVALERTGETPVRTSGNRPPAPRSVSR